MCTLITVSHEFYLANPSVEAQIKSDSGHNRDGWALVLVKSHEVSMVLRTMKLADILTLLTLGDWDRMFLHARFGTRGGSHVANCHAWASGGYLYMHNGILSDPETSNYAVDSELIGQWLKQGPDYACRRLRGESFANVFMIGIESGCYYVSRSQGGLLHEDGQGNYSSQAFGPISKPVKLASAVVWEKPKPKKQDPPAWPNRYRDGGLDDDYGYTCYKDKDGNWKTWKRGGNDAPAGGAVCHDYGTGNK